MQELWIEILLYLFFEFYESSWQRGRTFQEMLAHIYERYQRGIFYFFFSHPSFYFALYLGLKYDLTNFWFLSLLFFKFMDISYKLVIVKKIEENALAEVLPISLQTPIAPWMSYLNVVLYPALLIASLQS